MIAGNGLTVSLCLGEKPKHRRLKIFDPQGRQLIRKTEYKFTCLAHKHNAVYLGGQYRKGRGELFAMLDLSCLDFRAEEIALPLQGVEGKSIDDMLVQGDRLILADNIIFPKYLFEYGIADAARPVHRQTIELPNNGAYEHIYKGAASEERIVLFSGSVGMNGARRHISILDRRGAALAAFSMADNKLRDIALSGNRLLLLCEDALRGLDLNGTLAKDAVTAIAPNDRGMEKIIAVEDGLCVVCDKNGYAVLDVSPGPLLSGPFKI